MISPKKIALITIDVIITSQVKNALAAQFNIEAFNDLAAFQQTLNIPDNYCAIIYDADLQPNNKLDLNKIAYNFSLVNIPFVMLLSGIEAGRYTNNNIKYSAEIFIKPLDEKAIRTRIPYIIEHHTNKIAEVNPMPIYKLSLIKRLFDVLFSGIALLCLSPLFLLLAILIRLESKGAVFYYALRIGTGYRQFKFYKFRSMYTGADSKLKNLSHLNQYNNLPETLLAEKIPQNELCAFCENSGTVCLRQLHSDFETICETVYQQQRINSTNPAFFKLKNDPRVTRIGNFIRNTSIDELPQLWNVFIGDMSIVGNRPLPLYEADKVTTDDYALRFIAPAGITGLWQIEKRGKGEMSEEERLQLDNSYAKNHSFKNDIKIILKTIPALFQTENV